jgi:hypothetical protein
LQQSRVAGSTSRLEKHGEWLLALIAAHSGLTLDEVVAAMRKHGTLDALIEPAPVANQVLDDAHHGDDMTSTATPRSNRKAINALQSVLATVAS